VGIGRDYSRDPGERVDVLSGEREEDEYSGQDALWRMIIGANIAKTIEGLSVLCGEEFLTHDEHQEILDIMEKGAQRILDDEIDGLLEGDK